MDSSGEIKRLQEELAALSSELREQQTRISELQRRLALLTGPDLPTPAVPAPVTRPTHDSFENFIGLRLINFIGIVVLVIGLSIGVKYAIDQDLISQAMRIGLAYAAGCALFLLSLRLRKKYSGFSALLFSGSMASLYFTTYGAYVYYRMFAPAVAFMIMILLTFFTVYQALRYNRQEIGVLGLVGAYGIPFLISRNADRPELFFLYIAVINAAVVYLAVKKEWKTVARMASVITWILFDGWAAMRFNVHLQWLGFVFMTWFFLLFHAVVLSAVWIRHQRLTVNDTYEIMFNNLALCISSLFVFGYSFANADLAPITLVLSAVMAAQALFFHALFKQERYTRNAVVSLSFLLFVLFISFNWKGVSVTLLWMLTAITVFIIGLALKSVIFRLMAVTLMGITLLKLVVLDSLRFTTVQKVISYLALGVLLLLVAYFYQRFKERLFSDD